MKNNLPSVKTLKAITSYPKELRAVLECSTWHQLEALLYADKPFEKSTFGNFADTVAWEKSCYSRPRFHDFKMDMADTLCETSGVEFIERGRNEKSPSIEYLNAGDAYTATLLFVNGRYRVGCYGDIVERGQYA